MINLDSIDDVTTKVDSSNPNLSPILTSLGLISNDQLAIVSKEREKTGKSFSEAIISLGFISEQALNQIISEASGIKAIDLHETSLDFELVQKIPRHVAEQRQMIPVTLEDDHLVLAMVDVYDIRALDQARKYFPNLVIQPVLVTSSKLNSAIDRYYGYQLSIEKLLKEIEHSSQTLDEASWTSPVVRLVEALLLHGIKLKASDIHFQPEESYVRVRYRIDSVLQQHCVFHRSYWSAICVRLKVLSQLNLAESRRPQTGRMSLMYGMREVDFRVSSHPTVHGESIVLRILDKQHSIRSLEHLGFTTEQVATLIQQLKQPQGLFVITGPTGSGKTTTLYSILQYLNSSTRNIMTLEQPVEYRLPMIRQSEIKEMTQTSFADGVRSLLRQDADIIFIGEVRDEDTAKMALRAAMTGHLVFTTLHTNDSISVISRLRDLGLKPSIVADYLVASVSQRLLRLLCLDCSGKGCDLCHQTGYKGRQAVGEILLFSKEMKDLVANDTPLGYLRRAAKEQGFQPMRSVAKKLIASGLTTAEEVEFHLGFDHDDS
jgi:type II secretory ATPase GspE/PulE/Tfp pilus assembly ATPase PilB-like protein